MEEWRHADILRLCFYFNSNTKISEMKRSKEMNQIEKNELFELKDFLFSGVPRVYRSLAAVSLHSRLRFGCMRKQALP